MRGAMAGAVAVTLKLIESPVMILPAFVCSSWDAGRAARLKERACERQLLSDVASPTQ